MSEWKCGTFRFFFFFLFKMTLENNMPIHYYSMSTLTIFTCKVMNFELKTFISFFIVKNLIQNLRY